MIYNNKSNQKMNLQETIQKQIDEVMDTFEFERCSEALRLVGCCWLNGIDEEDRVYQIRKHGRKRMKRACAMAITSYEALRNDPEEMIHKTFDTGCLIGHCSIYTGDKEQKPWVKVNLTCYIDNSINDGEEFSENPEPTNKPKTQKDKKLAPIAFGVGDHPDYKHDITL